MALTRTSVVGAALVAAAAVWATVSLRSREFRVPEHVPEAKSPQPTAPAAASSIPELDPSALGVPLPAGRAVPDLPPDAPARASFGVVLITYRGAESAPPDARPKDAALKLAQALLPDAKLNFDEAVKKGDTGSTVDAGMIPRGVLEPEVEYALFTLKKGQVYDSPLDTPRGFWILRRNK